VRWWDTYVKRRAASEPAAFYRLSGGGELSGETVNKVLKNIMEVAGVSAEVSGDYATNSLRKGGVTAAFGAHVPREDIKAHGGWRSNAVDSYNKPSVFAFERVAAAVMNPARGGESGAGSLDFKHSTPLSMSAALKQMERLSAPSRATGAAESALNLPGSTGVRGAAGTLEVARTAKRSGGSVGVQLKAKRKPRSDRGKRRGPRLRADEATEEAGDDAAGGETELPPIPSVPLSVLQRIRNDSGGGT